MGTGSSASPCSIGAPRTPCGSTCAGSARTRTPPAAADAVGRRRRGAASRALGPAADLRGRHSGVTGEIGHRRLRLVGDVRPGPQDRRHLGMIIDGLALSAPSGLRTPARALWPALAAALALGLALGLVSGWLWWALALAVAGGSARACCWASMRRSRRRLRLASVAHRPGRPRLRVRRARPVAAARWVARLGLAQSGLAHRPARGPCRLRHPYRRVLASLRDHRRLDLPRAPRRAGAARQLLLHLGDAATVSSFRTHRASTSRLRRSGRRFPRRPST